MISNIKDLPTDNLYKFMAIFGLGFIVGMIVGWLTSNK